MRPKPITATPKAWQSAMAAGDDSTPAILTTYYKQTIADKPFKATNAPLIRLSNCKLIHPPFYKYQ